MIWVAAIFIVVAFLVLAWLLRIPPRASEVMQRARRAVADMRDPDLSEREKERSMQEQARRLFVLFLLITASGLVSLLVPVGLIAACDAMDLIDLGEVLEATVSWEFLLAVSIIGCATYAVIRSRRQ